MRPERAALIFGAALLLLWGFRPDALPFAPQARFSDAVLSHWLAAHHLRESVLLLGAFPAWQDTIMAGQPFAANPLNKTAYPLQWLALLLEPSSHLNLLIILHLLLAGWGMWRWGRSLGLRVEAAAVSALAYALAPRALAHLGAGHLDLIYALAWWPWLMCAVGELAQTERPLNLTLQTGLFAGLLLLADVRLGLFALALAGAYLLWRAAVARCWRAALRLIPVGILCVWMTLAVTLPLLGWGPYLSRGDLDRAGAGLYSVETGHLIGMVLAPRGGTPETFAYLGLGKLALALVGLGMGLRTHAFWLAATLVAALYALGVNGPLWPPLVDAIPLLRWFRVPGRAWLVVVLCVCLLAGFGTQAVLALGEQLRAGGAALRLRALRLSIGGFTVAALLCGVITLAVAGLDPLVGMGAALIGGLTGGVMLLALYARLTPTRTAWALLFIVVLDVGWVGSAWLEWRGPESWLHHQDELAQALSGADRVYSPNYALEQQVAAAHGLRLFGGVDPFQLRGLAAAIAQAGGIEAGGYSVVQPPLGDLAGDDALDTANCDATPRFDLLAAWGVSHIVSRCQLPAGGANGLRIVNNTYIYENPAYTGPAELTRSGWVPGWPSLPDTPGVDSLNRLTFVASLLSAGVLLICLTVLAWRFAHES